jgi:uncharacterized DUF497 family protein
VKYEWDEEKRQRNIVKHRIDFTDVVTIFEGPVWSRLDLRRPYGEDRWLGTGWMSGRLIVVVYTENHQDVIRIISARKAERYEKEEYFRSIRH